MVDRLFSFFASLGVDLGFGTYDVFYRFKALRTIIREKRYESALQSVGYTIDLIMNTLYVCLLYSKFILYFTHKWLCLINLCAAPYMIQLSMCSIL